MHDPRATDGRQHVQTLIPIIPNPNCLVGCSKPLPASGNTLGGGRQGNIYNPFKGRSSRCYPFVSPKEQRLRQLIRPSCVPAFDVATYMAVWIHPLICTSIIHPRHHESGSRCMQDHPMFRSSKGQM